MDLLTSTDLPSPLVKSSEPLYVRIAEIFEIQIRNRTLQAGDRLPSLREISRRLGVSLGTAVAAYWWLERHGRVESRPRSGFYVAEHPSGEPGGGALAGIPTRVALSDMVLEIQATARDPMVVPFGEAAIGPELLPITRLNRSIRRALSAFPRHAERDDAPAGTVALRRQIARLSYRWSCTLSPENVIVTSGGMEALNLAIRAVAEPGGIVAVESPGCFEVLRALESLGVQALEIPSRPHLGPDLAELERAACEHPVKAFLVSVCCHNPLGHGLPDATKAEIVALAGRLGMPIIEDDAFGDLSFSPRRPRPLKSLDTTGNVLYCGSYSHVVAPGFHLGFVSPGRFRAEVESLKVITTTATDVLPQLALAELMESGAYERHLRKLLTTLSRSTRALRAAIAEHFPRGTRMTHPDGGFYIWVQLPDGRSGLDLYRAALSEGIAVVPGTIFSPNQRFEDYIRVACGWPWSERASAAVASLGALAKEISSAASEPVRGRGH